MRDYLTFLVENRHLRVEIAILRVEIVILRVEIAILTVSNHGVRPLLRVDKSGFEGPKMA